MLATGLDVAAHGGEVASAGLGPERPADLLLEFGHPQVPLALVVVERDGQVGHEAEDFVAVVPQGGG